MLEQLILIIHALAAILIVGLILIQQGKGADAGASFGGGSSQTVFGVQGGGNLLTRWTSICAVLFFATSLSLAYFAKQKSESIDIIIDEPIMVESQALSNDIPVAEAADVNAEVPVVDAIVDEDIPVE